MSIAQTLLNDFNRVYSPHADSAAAGRTYNDSVPLADRYTSGSDGPSLFDAGLGQPKNMLVIALFNDINNLLGLSHDSECISPGRLERVSSFIPCLNHDRGRPMITAFHLYLPRSRTCINDRHRVRTS